MSGVEPVVDGGEGQPDRLALPVRGDPEGATSWAGSTCCLPSGDTSYTLPNSTASPCPALTSTWTVGEPVTLSGSSSGAESKRAYWPGKSIERPTPREDSWARPPPTPGTAEMAGGLAPAGLRNVFVRPPRATLSVPLLSPGYVSLLAPRVRAAPSVESMPPVRVTRKPGPVSAPLSSFRYRSNQSPIRRWTRSVSWSPPSCPPHDPVDGDRCAVAADGPGHGVGLAEREEGVGLALHDERGHLDPVGDGAR